MLVPSPLEGPRAKLNRARKHLAEVEGEIARFGGELEFRVEYLHVGDQHQFVARMTKSDLPLEWGVIIGDVLYNLRSSLDHLAWLLARLRAVPPPDPMDFPIFKDAKRYDPPGRKSENPPRGSGVYKVRGLRPKEQSAIERLQPYHSTEPEQHPLWVLNELRNRDTHATILVVLHSVLRSELRIDRLVASAFVGPRFHQGPVHDGTVLMDFQAKKATGVVAPEFVLVLSFAADSPAAPGRPVLGVLHELVGSVEGIVEQFGRTTFTRPPRPRRRRR